MSTKVYFQNYDRPQTLNLIEDLIVESIKFAGVDMMYLPRRRNSFDEIYYEDDTSSFDTFYEMEMYVKSYGGFEGQGTFMSKFGLEIRDELQISLARRTFFNRVTNVESEIVRPREGDLIYFPFNNKVFVIKFVEDKPFFYQFGDLFLYDLSLETYEYSNERFETGIEYIDNIQERYSTNALDFAMVTEDGYVITTDAGDIMVTDDYISIQEENNPIIDNTEFADEVEENDLIDFSEDDPYSEGNY